MSYLDNFPCPRIEFFPMRLDMNKWPECCGGSILVLMSVSNLVYSIVWFVEIFGANCYFDLTLVLLQLVSHLRRSRLFNVSIHYRSQLWTNCFVGCKWQRHVSVSWIRCYHCSNPGFTHWYDFLFLEHSETDWYILGTFCVLNMFLGLPVSVNLLLILFDTSVLIGTMPSTGVPFAQDASNFGPTRIYGYHGFPPSLLQQFQQTSSADTASPNSFNPTNIPPPHSALLRTAATGSATCSQLQPTGFHPYRRV